MQLRRWFTFTALFIFLCAGFTNAQILPINPAPTQQPDRCGFDIMHQQMMQTNPQYYQNTVQFNQFMENYVPTKVSNTPYRIPVVVHVMETGNALTAITDDQIREGIKQLNERYRKVPGTPGFGNGVDVQLEFALAVRDPGGNCTNGIVRYDMTGNATYMASGVFSSSAGIPDATLKSLSVWNQFQYYNIWLVSEIDNNNGGAGIQGYAYFASSHGTALDGAVIMVSNWKNASSTTGTHELGHAFNLYHTFEGDGGGGSCPPNSNCTTQGDLVCDTPPHMRSSSNCPAGTNACDGGSSNDLYIHNYMDYSSDACQSEFTAGQRTRVIAAMTTIRTSFLESNGNLSLVPPTTAGIDFTASSSGGCVGTTINFVDMSSCIPNTFLDSTYWTGITFNWTITNGTTTYTSTLQNPSITFTQSGVYNVTLSITNAFGTTSSTEQGFVVITNAPVAATCNATSSYVGTIGYGIRRVILNTLNHSSGGTYEDNQSGLTVNGYGDFSCSESTILQPNTLYNFSIEGLQTNPGNGEDFRVYIDYNNDGDFLDAGENVLTWNNAPAPTGLMTQSFTTSATPVLNTMLRMRVISARDTETITPCMVTTRGQCHDFGVYFSNNVASVSIAVAPSNTITYGTSTTFTATPVNGGASPTYAWYVNGVLQTGVTGNTFVSTTLVDGDQVYCVMTSNLVGVIASPATSNTITMTVTGPPLSDFTANVTQGCAGTVVTFTDLSLLSPTSWSWNFQGGTPATSTAQNPTIAFNTPGTYAITLTASNGFGTGTTEVKTAYITIYPTPAGICASFTRSNTPTAGIGITNVTLNTINNNTVYNGAVYNDYACSQMTTLAPSTNYPISVTVGSPNNQWVRVYIDYNQNNSFADAGELVFSPAIGTGIRAGNFTTPASPVMNQLLRMRVISDFTNTTPGPCTTPLQYGQVEDYGVIFMSSCVAPAISSQPVSATVCAGTNASYTLTATGTPILTYQWGVSTNGGVSWAPLTNGGAYSGVSTPTLNITGATLAMNGYLYVCAVTNSCGNVSSSIVSLTVNANPVINVNSFVNPTNCTLNNGSITVGGSGAGVVSWTGTSSGSSGTVTLPYTIASLGAGSYTISFVSNGCTSNSLVQNLSAPSAPPAPTISASGPTTFCAGGSVTLTSSYGSGNTWSTSATTNSIVVSTSGSYTVTYTDGGGCTATSAPVLVTVNPLPPAPTINPVGPLVICAGSSAVLTSSQATGNTWSTAQTTQSITVNTAGSYTVTYTDGNACTSLPSAAVSVSLTTSAALPYAQGFTGATFVPANWTMINAGGTANWQRSATVGTAPTAGNSMFFNNYDFNDTGFNDEVRIEPLDFSGGTGNTLTFDVAYARYDAANFDGLEVLVSTDCGSTFSSVYLKTGSTLATNADQTSAYVPGNWRNETVDLSAYDGAPSVIIAFRNIAGWGQNLYVDNINIAATPLCNNPTVPTLSVSPASYCSGNPVTISITGTLNDATAWNVYTGSCGGTAVGSTAGSTFGVTASGGPVIYYVRGEGACVTPGACASVTVTPTAPDNSSFSYASSVYCVNAADPTPTITGLSGGTFSSSPAGLSLNATTGVIDVSASTPGTYTVTYTTSGTCPSSSNVSVTINALDNASFSYSAGAYCVNGSDPGPTITGLTGGTFSSSPAGLSLNAATGVIDVSTSTPGTYTVTYTTSGTCPNSSNVSVTINLAGNASFNYPSTNFCPSDPNPIPTITGTPGGTFTSSPAGLSINPGTGQITITSSIPGPYTVTYTTPGPCPATSNQLVTISGNPPAPVPVTPLTVCVGSNVILQATGSGSNSITYYNATLTPLGTVAMPPAATSLNIGLLAAGTHNFTAVEVGTTGCPSPPANIVVNVSNLQNASFSYAASSYCVNGSDPTPVITGVSGGTFSASPAGLSINASTGLIDVSASAIGTYTVTYTTAGPCPGSSNVSVTIKPTSTGSQTATACTSYIWPANGTTYTASGVYTATLTNSVGCDSVVTLNLTINNATSGTQTTAACNSYTWSANGTTYTASGVYTATLTNATGCDSVVTLNLTINNATSGTQTTAACNSYTWSANGTTYTASGVYTATLTNAAGCDSVVTLNLTINNATSGTQTTAACNSYTWPANGTTYTASGVYTATLTNTVGCDSVVTLNLTINNATSGTQTTAACNSYTWPANGTTYTASGVYTATLTNSVGCDSVVTLNLTINNATSGTQTTATCNSYTWPANGTTYTASGVYTATLTNVAGCDSVVTLNLTINNATSSSQTASACDSYTWSTNGATYTASGVYTATLTNSVGCDSVVALNLTITPSPVISLGTVSDPGTCGAANGSIVINGTGTGIVGWTGTVTGNSGAVNLPYTISGLPAGSYTIGFSNGCNSNILTQSLVDPSAPPAPVVSVVNNCGSSTLSATGSNLTWSTTETTSSITVTTAGTYTVTQTVAGCTGAPGTGVAAPLQSTSGSQTTTTCTSYTWPANGTTYTASGVYTATLTNAAGCDSVVTLNLTINNATSDTQSATACNSYTWSANGTTYTASGVYTATLTNAAGCDSIVTLNLTINNATSGTQSATACNSYTWSANGTTYMTSGVYTATLTNSVGCDSVVTLNLTINNATSGTQSATACNSYTWSANGTTYTASGVYTATLTNAAGCDSVVTLNLTINNATSGTQSATACNSYTWSANGTTYTASGVYMTTLTNSVGCDSVVTLNLTINNATSGTQSATACNSYTWSANGTTYTASGVYTATLTNAAGCDSVVTLNLTINNATSGTQSATACNSYTWSANGTTYTASGVYTATLTNATGCDSVVTLNLTINNATSGTQTTAACNSYTWSANGTTYTASGVYTATLTNAAGCDSVVTLNLTINNATSGTQSATACNSYTWSANGTTYTASGVYTATLTNAAGCDSVVTLNLTINNATSGTQTTAACNSYTWSANGTTYTASGVYTATLTNATGCDSVVTLNLTINNATSGTQSATACNSYTWSANGTTYTASGVYTTTLTNAAGCDSVVTLNLTINNATSGSQSATACNSYTWSANGTTYMTSGVYTATLTNSVGCDSVATLNLTINNATSGTQTTAACNSYTWPANGTTYTTSGVYTATLTNSVGCDSVVTLNLTITNSTSGTESVTACTQYTWPANGSNYTTSGVYTATLTNAAGCDSIAILNLTINSVTTGTESAMACNSYTWAANGTTYTTSGSYSSTLTNVAGCDSVAVLNLTINNSPVISNGGTIDPTTCAGTNGSIVISGTGTGDLSWTGPTSGNLTGVSLPQTISGLGAGTYVFQLTDLCTSNSLSVTLSDPATPSQPIATVVDSCGQSTLAATGSNLLWSTFETTPTIVVTTAGVYSVTQTVNGCTSAPTLVTASPFVPVVPTITANGPTTFCTGDNVALTSSASFGNTWSTSQTAQTIAASIAGNYYVTTIDINGCTATSNIITITVNPLPSVSFGAVGEICEYYAPITLTQGAPVGGTYSGTGVTSGVNFDPSIAGIGTHILTYSFTDGNGCTNSAFSQITVDSCLSVVDLNPELIGVYPNPTNGKVTIAGGNLQIEVVKIYDAAGRLVLDLNSIHATEFSIDLNAWSSGMYNFEIHSNAGIAHRRVLRH